jgi:hypothetical protein
MIAVGYGTESGIDYYILRNRQVISSCVVVSPESLQSPTPLPISLSPPAPQLGLKLGRARLYAPQAQRRQHVRHRLLRLLPFECDQGLEARQ